MASKIAEFAHLLGKVPDEKIAEMADVKPDTVARYRKAEGIAEFVAEGETPAEPDEVPKAAAEPEAVEDEGPTDEDVSAFISYLEKRGYTVTAPGAKPKPAEKATAPATVKLRRSALLQDPEGGPSRRWNYGDIANGDDAAWLWKHHQTAVKSYP